MPESLQIVRDVMSKTMSLVEQGATSIEPITLELEQPRKDGSTVWTEAVVKAMFDEQGRFTGYLGVTRDITARKQAEEALQNVSGELQLIFKNMINAFVIWESVFDENGKYVSFRFGQFNDAYARISQLKYEDVRGKDVFEVWPSTEQGWVTTYGEVAFTGKPRTFEMYHDATKGWYRCNAYRPTDSPSQVCVIFEDITTRKQAEDLLHRTQTLLNETQHITKVGGWEYNPATRQTIWTDEMYQIYGLTKDHDLSNPQQNMIFYTPDDQEVIAKAFQRAVELGEPYDLELQLVRAQGEKIWVRTIGQAETQNGKVVRVFGNIMDITERKQAEALLKDQVDELRRWHTIMMGRENRILKLKSEVNKLLVDSGKPPRYTSVQDKAIEDAPGKVL
jgi:two-component system CheB/CheR fusion protein